MLLRQSDRTLLSYPGGKSRGVPFLMSLFPKGIKEVVSPFLGGGSVELTLSALGVDVIGYDAYAPLVNFWQQALAYPSLVAGRVLDMRGLGKMDKAMFDRMKASYDTADPVSQAAMYFIINKLSFSGMGFSGGYSRHRMARVTTHQVERLRNFKSTCLQVGLADWRETLAAHPDAFLFCDPPYLLERNSAKLYGMRGDLHQHFDHEGFANALRKRKGWIMTNCDSPAIHSLYAGCAYKHFDMTYTYRKQKGAPKVREVAFYSL